MKYSSIWVRECVFTIVLGTGIWIPSVGSSGTRMKVIVTPFGSDEQAFRITFDGSDHRFVADHPSVSERLEQVNNPWRTWLPRKLPENH